MKRKRIGLGEYKFNDKSLYLKGMFRFQGENYLNIVVDGFGYNYSKNDIHTNHLLVKGVFFSKKNITTSTFDIEGFTKINGNIRTQNANISGYLKNSKGNFEAESITGTGAIINKTEINTDEMHFTGYIHAQNIYGDNIDINSIRTIPNKFINPQSYVGSIEATQISVAGCNINSISGSDIYIGDNCNIKYVYCTGKLTISSKSNIKHIEASHYEII